MNKKKFFILIGIVILLIGIVVAINYHKEGYSVVSLGVNSLVSVFSPAKIISPPQKLPTHNSINFPLTSPTGDYYIIATGNESKYIDLNKSRVINKSEVILYVKPLKDRTYNECETDFKTFKKTCKNVIYNPPDSLPVRDSPTSITKTNILKKTDSKTNEDYFVYTLNGEHFLKIGDASVYIIENVSSNGLHEDTIAEDSLVHLNISDSNLFLYYPMDKNETSVLHDYSEKNNDGTITGAVYDSSGVYGGSYYFDGSDYILTDTDISLSMPFTLTSWVKSETTTAKGVSVSYAGSAYTDRYFSVGLNDSNSPFIIARDGTTYNIYYDEQAVDNTWHMITGVFLSDQAKLYVDGVFVYNLSHARVIDGEDRIAVGTNGRSSLDDLFTGSIDEPAVYTVGLNSSQISDIYNNQSARFKQTGNASYRAKPTDTGNNRVNLTAGFQNNMNTNLSARIGMINDSLNNSNGLILYMPCEWGKGIDVSGRNNKESARNTTWLKTGGLNGTGGFDFDDTGQNQSITINSSSGDFDVKNITITAWVNRASNDSVNTIVAKFYKPDYIQYSLSLRDTPIRFYYVDDADNTHYYDTTEGVPLNKWTFVAVTFQSGDGSSMKMYINGENASGSWVSGTGDGYLRPQEYNYSETDLWVGMQSHSSYPHEFDGKLDEIRMYNRTLSEEEIQQIYNHDSEKYNTIYYTDYQNLTTSESPQTFTINSEADYVFPNFKFISDNNQFYSPVLLENITIDTYTEGGGVTDTEYPQFSNYYDNNASLIDSGTGLFNVTVTHTNGTVILHINGSDIEATNLTADIYNASYDFTSAGVYPYNWTAYGNGTNNNLNTSDLRSYTVKEKDIAPCGYHIAPANNSINSSLNIIFEFNATAYNSTYELKNATLYIWNTSSAGSDFSAGYITSEANITGIFNETNFSVSFQQDGNYKWSVKIYDIDSNLNWTDENNWTLTLDSTAPQIAYDSQTPLDETNSTDTSVYVNVTLTESNFENMSYYLYNETLPLENLVGYWNLDRNLSTQKDLSGNGNDGTVYGATFNSSGKLGGAYEFDNKNDYITVPYAENLTEFTISMWITPKALQFYGNHSGFFSPINGGGQNKFDLIETEDGDGSVSVQFRNDTSITHTTSATANYNIKVGRTDFLVLNYNKTSWNFYVNGQLNGTQALSIDYQNIEFIFNHSIGRDFWNVRQYNSFNGSIDEVMIFNKSLTTDEVSNLYYRGLVNHTTYSSKTLDINWTNLPSNSYHYFVDALDTAGNYNATEIRRINLDSSSPYFTAIPDNQTINYTQGFGVDFNATDEVSFDSYAINWTSDFQINQSGWLENTTLIGVGTYLINVTINDSLNNLNSTVFKLIVDKANPSANMQITGTTPIEYPTTSDFAGSETNIGDEGCSYSMDRSNGIYGAGTWTFNYSTSGCENYTAGSVTKDLVVNKNTSLVLGLTGTTPIEYPTETDFTGSGCPSELSCSLNISNGVYGAGDISANYSTNGNENYSATSTTFTITINQNASYVLTISGTTPIDYGTTTDVTGGSCPSELSCSLNPSNDIYGAGVVTFNYSTSGDENYSANSITKDITINKISPSGSITGTTPIDYGTAGDVQGSETNTGDDDVIYTLYRDGTEVSNPDTATLGVGTYNYIYNATGGENYTDNSSLDTFSLVVNQISSSVNLTLNNVENNVSISQGDSIDLNCSVISGDAGAYVELWRNGSLINNGTSSIGNTTTFNYVLNENITCVYENTQNYSRSSEEFWVDVTSPSDTTPPYFTYIDNFSIYTNESIEVDLNATDETGFDCFSVNDTTNFKINCSGYLENTTGLSAGMYYLNITINDTSNNLNSSIMWINVTSIADTTPPTFDNLRNFTHIVNTSFSESITASDPSGIDTYKLNDTSIFIINSTNGLIMNATNLSIIETYWLNISVNDTAGNLASGVFYIDVTELPPVSTINFIYPRVTFKVPYIKQNEHLIFT